MSEDRNQQDPPPIDEHLLQAWQRRFPRAGYWFNVLPTHPFIHGPGGLPAPAPPHQPPPGAFQPPPGPPPAHHVPPPPPPGVPGYFAPGPTPHSSQEVGAEVADTSRTISLSIPRNTGVQGAAVVRVNLTVPFDIPFPDFFDRVCAQMDLHPANAKLGYKYHTDRVRDPPHQLSTAQELREAMEIGWGLMRRARTRVIQMEIHNLSPPPPTAAPPSRSGGKRKALHDGRVTDGDVANDESGTTLSFLREYRELRTHLNCDGHPNRLCYVSPINGEHIPIDNFKLTLWAKKIFQNEASLREPPSTLEFDHVPKKPRRSGPSPSASTPAINLYITNPVTALDDQLGMRRVNTQPVAGPSSAPAVLNRPMPSCTHSVIDLTTSRTHSLIDLTADSEDEDVVLYPSTASLLANIHAQFPLLEVPRYAQALIDYGYMYVHMLESLDADAVSGTFNMPPPIAELVLNEARTSARRARKGKGKAVQSEAKPKAEVKEENL
ncbi:hypothetical protein BV25DRAFT_1921523 [Artomyces pyxidatus]|uniref:Uncharacterized protein n=1 Tax=Artomyces pyxidatus TaxID=48021 RepID=A0ACB8SHS9_9AGAM|nr:hypothetical protein BV25DRAFT_1921523 [Artomyces pyxidatus]